MAIYDEPQKSIDLPWKWMAIIAVCLVGLIGWALQGPLEVSYIQFLTWVYAHTREFQEMLTQSVKSLADDTTLSTTMALVGASFLYGVFHAAGPGHGKIILSTYLLSQPERIGKSVALAAASSLVQGLVAIFLVYGLFFIFGVVSRDMNIAVSWSERLAFALVVVIGFMLTWRGIKPFLRNRGSRKHDAHSHSHDHDHDHDHGHHHHHKDASCDHHHHHHVEEAPEVCPSCGHAHVPSSEQVENATDLKAAIGVVLSIGMRPCTGAILVLVFARFVDVSWAGALAVLAMSIGTAITVSALAIAAVSARDVALKLLGSTGALGTTLGSIVAVGGGTLLILFGVGLFLGSFEPPTRSMGL